MYAAFICFKILTDDASLKEREIVELVPGSIFSYMLYRRRRRSKDFISTSGDKICIIFKE